MAPIGSFLTGLYQDQPVQFSPTPPPEAPDGAIEREGDIRTNEIAGTASTFVAHGVGIDSMGSYPGAGRASQIPTDLNGPQIVSPARTGDGYHLREAGTPEPALYAPKRGPILDSRGYVHLGIGPAVPIALLAIVAGALYLLKSKGPVTA